MDNRSPVSSVIFRVAWCKDASGARFWLFQLVAAKLGVTFFHVNEPYCFKRLLQVGEVLALANSSTDAIVIDGGTPETSFYLTGPVMRIWKSDIAPNTTMSLDRCYGYSLRADNMPVGPNVKRLEQRSYQHPKYRHWDRYKLY